MEHEDIDFDLGPLTWVKAELDHALTAAKQALVDWNGADLDPLTAAQAHLHQVAGALNIVDLQGVAQLCAQAERLLADMGGDPVLRTRASADVVIEACDAVTHYLNDLMAGAPNAELRLSEIYGRVLAQRGAEPPPPSELFYPDLSLRVSRDDPPPLLAPEALARAIRRTRAQYQKGLLLFLQNKEPAAGLMSMDQAVRELEKLAPDAGQYTFWWLAAGFVESLRRGALPVDFWVKRLCGRIDLQMRRLMEGSRQLAERVQRDVLYYLAQDKSAAGRALDARRRFRLDRYLPAEVSEAAAQAEAGWRPHLNALREALETAKDHWMRVCSGRPESLAPFQDATMAMFEAAVRLPNESLKSLLRMVQAVAKRLPSVSDTVQNEALQLEMATAILLTQNACEHFQALGQEFDRQADVLTQRMQAAIDPSYDTSRIPTDVPLLDAVSRQAQEKLILAQITQEIQANLNQVEEILDRFFRDRNERSRLPLVPGMMKQVLGALNILQLDTAADLTRASLEYIDRFADPEYAISPEELDWVADALSTLGLYMEALRYGRDDPQRLASLLARRQAMTAPAASVEAQIQTDIAGLQRQAAALADGDAATEVLDALKTGLVKLLRDAELVGDSQLKAQVEQALHRLDAHAPASELHAAIQAIGRAVISPVMPSPEAAKLVDASAEAIDAEMLDVYIEEANDVLGNIVAQLSRLHVNPFDADAFVAIRRGFHTLKGSGRMVGLTDLAEVAWQVEDTLNQWLRSDRPPTPEMLDFLDQAVDAFTGWVQVLEAGSRPQVQAEALVAWAQALRGREASPPPKAEAGAPAHAPAAGEDETIALGTHQLPAALYRIFVEEAAQRVDDLRENLRRMARGHDASAWEAFILAAHTLAGIARTTGLTPLSEAAHAVETWAGDWPDKTHALDDQVQAVLAACTDGIAEMLEAIRARQWPQDRPDIQTRLTGLNPASMATELPGVVETGPADAGAETTLQAQAQEPLTAAGEPGAETAPGPGAPQETQQAAALAADRRDDLTHPAYATAPAQANATANASAQTEAGLPPDDIDPQLLPLFLDEAAELLPRIGAALRQWRDQPDDAAARNTLQRALHTLKGSARMAGAMALGEQTHRAETRLLEHAESAPSPDFLDQLEADYDRLAAMVDALQGKPGGEPVAPTQTAPQPGPVEAAVTPLTPAEPVVQTVTEEDLRLRQTLRLKANILDTLLNEAGEVAIARARVQNLLDTYKQTAQELTANVERLRNQLRELEIQAESQLRSRLARTAGQLGNTSNAGEGIPVQAPDPEPGQPPLDESWQFDPLEFDRYTRLQELTRLLSESVNDVSTAQDNLLAGIDEADRALHQQSRMTRNLQHELMRLRMVPFDTLSERLHRVVRQAAKDLGRKAQLEIEGARIELDRTVLDRIAAPLEHLLRNAVAHGIEPPQLRQAAGKPEQGRIRVSLQQEGNEIVIVLDDDGAGVNLGAVRARAEALGWIAPTEEVSGERLESFLFTPGFSTADQVTEVAGRGIGLDVVKNEIAGVGGRVRLDTEPGRGTRFTLRLPLTLAVTPVVLARAGGQTFALPANLVALVREVRQEELAALQQAGELEAGGERYPLRSLAELLDLHSQPGEGRYRTLLLLRSGTERLALRIDALEGNFEAVMKNTGPQVARITGIVGATVLADGRIALILNPFALAERAPARKAEAEAIEGAVEQPPLVMVVDDSLTMRKITSRLLQREGYRVVTAKDGVEALELLQDEAPAVMLLDIEMPRLDGYEVTRAIRANSRLAHIPIIMITSRTAEKHRRHAFELGVNHYMGKPYDEQALLNEIARLTGRVVEIH
jgi:chemosensory pili system protein ChpA (sensor histidine kinase/response regulator)